MIGNQRESLFLFFLLVYSCLILGFLGLPNKLLVASLALLIFLISFVNTDFALIVLIFSMLLSPEFQLGHIPGRAVVLRIDDLFIFLVFFGWLAKMAVNKELGLLKTNPLNKPILFYIFICIFSSGIGALRGTNNLKHSIFYLLKYFEYFILFFMVSNNLKSRRQAKIFIYFMLLVAFIVCVFALRVSLSTGMRATAPFEGKYGEPNTLAGYLIIIFSLILGLFIYSSSLKEKVFLLGLGGLVIPTFIYTQSRAGLLGALGMFLAFFLFSKKAKLSLGIFLIVVIGGASLIFPEQVFYRYKYALKGPESIDILGKKINIDESAYARLQSWNNSLRVWRKYPIIGWGVPGKGVVADVQYARVLREVGIIGFLIFLYLIFSLFRTGFNNLKTLKEDNFSFGLSLSFISFLTGLLFMGVGAEVFIIIRIMEPFWFLTAIVCELPHLK